MEAVLKKWGNSVALRLPNAILKEFALKENRKIYITAEKGKIVLTPKQKQPRYELASLLDKVTDSNRHELIDFGKPVGREIL
ncbi:MAG: AbrB/MazE/SpoVT family DNA-binding domain-containing protein [Nitrospirae bacterium]|nr:MAG: AbrB/MazE/SpoVT family DNA-binding domain-containing protein [Nitrospirota bacterium]